MSAVIVINETTTWILNFTVRLLKTLKTSRKFYLNIFTCENKKFKRLYLVFRTNSNGHALGHWRSGV